MPQKVKGFLAADGKFFDTEAECQRHEFAQAIKSLCDSHGINQDNFFLLLHEWHEPIQGYYNADSKCEGKLVIAKGRVRFNSDGGLPEEDIPQTDEDNEDAPIGDKDTPGFLEQQIGRYK